MSELAETTQFLAGREPWSLLPPGEAAAYARRATASYVRRGTQILTAGSPNSRMHVIRSGAVEVRDADGVLIDHDEEGHWNAMTTFFAATSGLLLLLLLVTAAKRREATPC